MDDVADTTYEGGYDQLGFLLKFKNVHENIDYSITK
jgi:hypothetical protein